MNRRIEGISRIPGQPRRGARLGEGVSQDTDTLDSGALARHSDIAFSRSTDAGQTWSAPVRINDDPQGNGVDQFSPTLAVRADGLIGVTWYDLAYAQSTDGGLTWAPNLRVSDNSGDSDKAQDFKGINDLGYRKDLVFGPDYALASWLGTPLRLFEGDFYVDRGVFSPLLSRAKTTGVPARGLFDITWPFTGVVLPGGRADR